jgi:hypothetical protein
MAWQGNGRVTAWERHGMCESAFNGPSSGLYQEIFVYKHKYKKLKIFCTSGNIKIRKCCWIVIELLRFLGFMGKEDMYGNRAQGRTMMVSCEAALISRP